MEKHSKRGRFEAVRWTTARALLGAAAIVSFSSVAAADPTAEQREESREHFRAGNEAFARGDNERALEEFQQAYVLAKSFDIACNLGRVEYQLALWPRAAEHLDECLANFAASTRADLRTADEKLSQLFDEVRSKVGLLRIDVLPERASVSVGQRSVLGPWPAKVFVLPGEHVVAASLAGRESDSRSVTVAAGEEQALHFDLQPAKAEPSPAESGSASLAVRGPLSAPPEDSLASYKVPVLVAGGVLSAAGIGLGAYFLVKQGSLRDEADGSRQAIAGDSGSTSACNDVANRARCDSLSGTLEDGRQAETMATLGFVAGGVFAAGTVAAYFLWPEEQGTASLRVAPTAFASGGGAFDLLGPMGAEVSGRF